MTGVEVAVVGAGPFGLALGAELGSRARVFGEPMLTWKTKMPPDMTLRSPWAELSFEMPGERGDIFDWARREGVDVSKPVPLSVFLRYASWYESLCVPEVEPADVVRLATHGNRFVIGTEAGHEVVARYVVVAVGVTPFQYAPPGLEALEGHPKVRFVVDTIDPGSFEGDRVTVVGGGQSALEAAGVIARSAERVTVVARSKIHWFTDREPYNPRGPVRRRVYELAYPVVGHGPPPLNRLVLHPDLYAKLPPSLRTRLTNRIMRAGGSPWLRTRMGDSVEFREGAAVIRAYPCREGIEVQLSDGSAHCADQLVLATGYRFNLGSLGFLDSELASRVRVAGGWPVLDRWFRSTVPNLFFVGYAAEGHFGPLCRFVLGTRFTSDRIAAYLGSAS